MADVRIPQDRNSAQEALQELMNYLFENFHANIKKNDSATKSSQFHWEQIDEGLQCRVKINSQFKTAKEFKKVCERIGATYLDEKNDASKKEEVVTLVIYDSRKIESMRERCSDCLVYLKTDSLYKNFRSSTSSKTDEVNKDLEKFLLTMQIYLLDSFLATKLTRPFLTLQNIVRDLKEVDNFVLEAKYKQFKYEFESIKSDSVAYSRELTKLLNFIRSSLEAVDARYLLKSYTQNAIDAKNEFLKEFESIPDGSIPIPLKEIARILKEPAVMIKTTQSLSQIKEELKKLTGQNTMKNNVLFCYNRAEIFIKAFERLIKAQERINPKKMSLLSSVLTSTGNMTLNNIEEKLKDVCESVILNCKKNLADQNSVGEDWCQIIALEEYYVELWTKMSSSSVNNRIYNLIAFIRAMHDETNTWRNPLFETLSHPLHEALMKKLRKEILIVDVKKSLGLFTSTDFDEKFPKSEDAEKIRKWIVKKKNIKNDNFQYDIDKNYSIEALRNGTAGKLVRKKVDLKSDLNFGLDNPRQAKRIQVGDGDLDPDLLDRMKVADQIEEEARKRLNKKD